MLTRGINLSVQLAGGAPPLGERAQALVEQVKVHRLDRIFEDRYAHAGIYGTLIGPSMAGVGLRSGPGS